MFQTKIAVGTSKPELYRELVRELVVRDRTGRSRVVDLDRRAVTRRLGEPHRAGNDGAERVVEVLADLVLHLLRDVRAAVVHRHDHATELEGG